jgi:hypothetical protein
MEWGYPEPCPQTFQMVEIKACHVRELDLGQSASEILHPNKLAPKTWPTGRIQHRYGVVMDRYGVGFAQLLAYFV